MCGLPPDGYTLRELFTMATARQREFRRHAVEQAMLVWGLEEIAEDGLQHYVQTGAMVGKGDGTLPYMSEVELKIAEIHRNGGKLTV